MIFPTTRFANSSFFHRGQHRGPVDRKRKLAILFSYIPDWILTILIGGLFLLLNKIEPFKREFSLDDTSIQHIYTLHERVSDTGLVLIALVVPLVLMAAINLISIRSFWDLHTSWLGAILALSLAGTITNIVKVTGLQVGRPRPDCIDRCQPLPSTANHPVFGLVNATICTQTDNAILKDGFRSFPSGHSSLSFAGLGFLAFYLAGKLHLFDERGYTAKVWLSLVPLMGAGLVAISRTMDYRHHWQDVLAGSLLGFFLAWFSYRQYYPPLASSLAHRPYSPRISRSHTPTVSEDHDANQREETMRLHPVDLDQAMELHRTQNGGLISPKQAQTLPNLRDIWQEGANEIIMPAGQQEGTSRPADEHV